MTSRLKFLHLQDYKGGLNTFNPASELEINESPDLDNVVLSEKGFFKRFGDTALNTTAMNSGANVQGLTYFVPQTGANAGTEYLVAVAGDKIYNSASFAATMTDITGAVTVTANQNNIWTFSKINDLCIGVGGAPDAPFKWSSSGNAAALGGTPPSGSFGFAMKDRMFIGGTTTNPSTIYWSILSNPEDWSGVGSGSGTFGVGDGDSLTGAIPINNNLAVVFKRYSTHLMNVDTSPFPNKPITYSFGCCGKNAMVNVQGVVYFITNEPRMRATDGYNFIDFPNSVNNIFDGINKSRLKYIQGVYDPVRNIIIWHVSMGSSTTNNYAIIWDLYRKCWLRYTTGYDCNVACIASGNRMFGGHTNGKIYEKNVSTTYIDASEGGTGAINSYWYTPWINNKSNMLVKHPRYIDINYVQQDMGNLKWSYGFDYNQGSDMGSFSQTDAGGQWDIGTWDNAVWGGKSDNQKRIYLYGRGNLFQFKIYNDVAGEAMNINSIDISFNEKGIKSMNAI